MAGILAWFWNERFWLPHNVTWADLQSTEEAAFPQAEDLYLAFPLAFCIFMIRLLFERFIAKPCALGLKVQANGPQKAQPNAILEKVFTAITKHPDEKRLEGLSKQLDWDVRSIQRWFRQRRNQEKPSTLTKFCESMWRFTFYLYIFTYGVRFLKKTPWLWNTRQCWNGYPYQPLLPDLHYYYIVELSFYWSLMFSQFIDIKRKDFGIMFTHHIVTVTLITFSYVTNLTRVGTLTLCLHDAADVVLEAAKMANYCKCQKLSDLLFLTFAIVFIVSRLGIYPLWILNTTLFELYEALGNFPALWIFNVLLVILQILHCFWSYLIIKAAYKAISKGKVAKDDRSDIESSSDEEETVPRSKTLHSTITTNGTSGANGTNGTKRFSDHTRQRVLIHCINQWMSKLWLHLPPCRENVMQLFPFSFEFVCFSAEELCKVLLEAIKNLEDNHIYSRKSIEMIRMAHGDNHFLVLNRTRRQKPLPCSKRQ